MLILFVDYRFIQNFKKAQKDSSRFKNDQVKEGSKGFTKVQQLNECSIRFIKLPEDSRKFPKVKEGPQRFHKLLEASTRFIKEVQDGS